VVEIAPELANAIAASMPNTVPPRYCMVPIEVVSAVPNVHEQLFIVPPPVEDDDYRARLWAQANGVAILPKYACNEQMLTMPAQQQAVNVPPGVTAVISSPAPGQTYAAGQQIDITGSATFPQGGFFKIEISGPGFPKWTTVGDINHWRNRSGVTDGVLQEIMPLPPGGYEMQLVVVGPDSNILAVVPSSFNVAG
jgi:hypothetical protein